MSTARTKVLIVGARGRMGEALMRLGAADAQLEITAGIDREENAADFIEACDVAVEFAQHAATPALARLAVEHGKKLVVGTTGHTEEERAVIRAASAAIPVVWAPNFSVGVNLLFYLTQLAAETLGESYDQEVVEMHHRLKLDAPSGTARRLGEILAEAAGGSYADLVRHGREGDVGVRPARMIGMHALRGGDVVGDHTVIFATTGERLELTHRASSRDTFAAGALRAARWACAQPAGLYSMQEVLGFGK